MITYFALWILIACILTLSVVDHGVDPWFGQIKGWRRDRMVVGFTTT